MQHPGDISGEAESTPTGKPQGPGVTGGGGATAKAGEAKKLLLWGGVAVAVGLAFYRWNAILKGRAVVVV